MRLWSGAIIPSSHGLEQPTDGPVSILVQCISGLGNAVMATPLLAELRRLYPNARIDVLTTPDAASLLSGNPHASRVIGDSYVATQSREDFWRSVREVRRRRYNACLLPITAIDYWYVARIALARVGTRVIHDYALHASDRFTTLCNYRVPFDQARHDVESNLDLLRTLTSAEVKAGPLVLPLSDRQKHEAREALAGLGWCEDKATVGFCPGSTLRWSHKRWPDEHYAELARRVLGDRRDMQVLVFCGPDEAQSARHFREEFRGEALTVVEGLPLPTYAAALNLCRAVVTGDSLPLQLAAALQVPQVSLFGPTDPRRTGPWQAPAKVLAPDCDYTPYYRIPYPPPPSKFPPCMPLIGVDDVEGALNSLLIESADARIA